MHLDGDRLIGADAVSRAFGVLQRRLALLRDEERARHPVREGAAGSGRGIRRALLRVDDHVMASLRQVHPNGADVSGGGVPQVDRDALGPLYSSGSVEWTDGRGEGRALDGDARVEPTRVELTRVGTGVAWRAAVDAPRVHARSDVHAAGVRCGVVVAASQGENEEEGQCAHGGQDKARSRGRH